MIGRSLTVVRDPVLPKELDAQAVYHLPPRDPSDTYYRMRTDRNLGWITPAEQQRLRGATIGIAGCGGMGGMLGSIFVRLGVGEIRISDCEVFDESNINRQFAATRRTVGQSKALTTAAAIREISDDTHLVVYPQGVCEETVDSFTKGCDIICDEIEFWAVGARILLHQQARRHGVTVFNCNTVGFSTRLFKFTPDSQTMEQRLDMDYEMAMKLQRVCQHGIATEEQRRRVMMSVISGLVPELPEYSPQDPEYQARKVVLARLMREGRASIIATNPPLASGFLADHILLHLLDNYGLVKRTYKQVPPVPSYLIFDAALLSASVRQVEP